MPVHMLWFYNEVLNHTFSVYYKDQIVHENFVGHDVNLVKLDNNVDLKVLENWMNLQEVIRQTSGTDVSRRRCWRD